MPAIVVGGPGGIRTPEGARPTGLQPVPFVRFGTDPMEPTRGFEPRTYSLPWSCSTTKATRAKHFSPNPLQLLKQLIQSFICRIILF